MFPYFRFGIQYRYESSSKKLIYNLLYVLIQINAFVCLQIESGAKILGVTEIPGQSARDRRAGLLEHGADQVHNFRLFLILCYWVFFGTRNFRYTKYRSNRCATWMLSKLNGGKKKRQLRSQLIDWLGPIFGCSEYTIYDWGNCLHDLVPGFYQPMQSTEWVLSANFRWRHEKGASFALSVYIVIVKHNIIA